MKTEREIRNIEWMQKHNDREIYWAGIVMEKDKHIINLESEAINLKSEINKKDAIIRDLSKQLTQIENELERHQAVERRLRR